ncbi:MAG: lytic transglycosylase domain-containing protein [Candidatus Aenigmatarchaeota archaeon]
MMDRKMKGGMELEDLGMTIIFFVILFAVVTIAVVIIFFTFNNQAKFSNDYAVLSGKSYSISEVLVARSYETRTNQDSVFDAVIGSAVPIEYKEPFLKASIKYGISPNLIAAIFKCGEHSIYPSGTISGGYITNTAANDLAANWPNINGPWASSPVGASGPFQFMPGSWETYKDDCNSDDVKDKQNIYDAACAAANHLKTRMSWPAKYDDKIKTTIWYYNNANWYVDRVYSCYNYLGGRAGYYYVSSDDRNAFDHSLAMTITGNDEIAMSAGFVNEISGFMDRYELGFYSVDVSKLSLNEDTSKTTELIQKVSKAATFCGSLMENCAGNSQDIKCIAYCEPGVCSPGREKYAKGNEFCGKSVCCSERYDWTNMVYTSYRTTEISCFGGKGVCAKTCALGREHVIEYDTDCKSMVCCVPVLPEKLPKVSDLGTEVSIPLLYKTTKNDPSGVLGYLTIGVSKD